MDKKTILDSGEKFTKMKIQPWGALVWKDFFELCSSFTSLLSKKREINKPQAVSEGQRKA